MEGETSTQKEYKVIEYNNKLYQIPIRHFQQEQVLLLSDIQALLPKATALLSKSTKLVPFQLDADYNEITPKRIVVSKNNDDDIYQAYIPQEEEQVDLLHHVMELHFKMDRLSDKLDSLLISFPRQENEDEDNATNSTTNTTIDDTDSIAMDESMTATTTAVTTTVAGAVTIAGTASSPSASQIAASNNSSDNIGSSSRHEAPPSYETSVLSTIKSINDKLCLYESHIYNRHKSPKWLAKRQEWLSREPNSIEQVAYQLVQLEMALLWTAVSESWIQERETWLSLVASARSERHLAGAIINLERHTLVMDEDWVNIRERWINDLLEMVVLPLSHG